MIAMLLRSAAVAALVPAAFAGGPAPAKPHVVTVVARDYAFEAPRTIRAGTVTFRLLNRGTQLHHIWLVRLEQGKTADDVMAALKAGGPPPAWAVDVGGPNSPVPGGEADATVTLAAGNYMLLCMIPASDNVIHAMKGMVAPLTVTGTAPAAEQAGEPAPDLTMKLADYGFQFSRPLTAGRHVIRIENVAQQSHEAFMLMLAPGKKAPDLLTWIEGGQKGPPPGMPAGGITGIAPGGHIILPVDLKPGRYALYCFVPDAKDGKPHFAHGMITELEVK